MSRGLGLIQVAILATLAEARAAAPSYPGSGTSGPGLPSAIRGTPAAEGWIWVGRSLLHLAPDVYDLRCTLAYWTQVGMPRRRWTAPGCVSNPLEATFSRAVKSLMRRGCLEPLWLVPIDAVDPLFCRERDTTWCQEEDGTRQQYFFCRLRTQIRFVRKTWADHGW
jgi:hypothetical protein